MAAEISERVWAAVNGGTAVSTDDIRRVAHTALRHRVIFNFEGEAGQIKIDDLITRVLDQVKTPAQMAA